MFKKYEVPVKGLKGEKPWTVSFFVHSKPTRSGFMHEACCVGSLPEIPREPGSDYYPRFDATHKARYARVSYCNRTWEPWSGRDCLVKLWDKLAKCKYVDMAQFPKCPFRSDEEPKGEGLWEPSELFERFTERS